MSIAQQSYMVSGYHTERVIITKSSLGEHCLRRRSQCLTGVRKILCDFISSSTSHPIKCHPCSCPLGSNHTGLLFGFRPCQISSCLRTLHLGFSLAGTLFHSVLPFLLTFQVLMQILPFLRTLPDFPN